jgi:uncharacterized membrane protein YgcG
MHRLLTVSGILALQIALLAALPTPMGYVNDFASVLDEPDEAYLETFLGTLERDTSAEVVVATVASLEGMTIEEYANRLFAEWGIGRGLNRISQIVRGDPEASARAAAPSAVDDLPPVWFAVPFFATFVVFGSLAAGLGLRTKTYAPLAAGGLFVGIPLGDGRGDLSGFGRGAPADRAGCARARLQERPLGVLDGYAPPRHS